MTRRGFFGVVIGILTGLSTTPKPTPVVGYRPLTAEERWFMPEWGIPTRTHLDRELVIEKWIYRPGYVGPRL